MENIVVDPKTWRYVFDAIEDPVFLHDTQFRVLLANRAYCREAGMTETEVLGKPYWEVFPRGIGPLPACKDAAISNDHDGSEEEVRAGVKLYLSRGSTVRDDQGKPLYSLHILSDITERNRAHASEERYRRLFESAKDGILILDAETGMVSVCG
jgi:PAS domain S-box-containing protein